ncbi:heme-binding protein soul2 [Archocentrus centrarchus]|uniref:heme-binding protein soul2 n=1 Tax=Archocentrus centrarchus TaxID=63155 RepID=UPI0011E9B40B|nr:heme-binding protein 2-like [Archocentrus centrarchus]
MTAQVMFTLLTLFLVSFCTGQDFCLSKKCPQCTVVETHPEFELRLCGPTDWITTKIASTSSSDVLAANSRLKDYTKRQIKAGYDIPTDSWPVLVTVTDSEVDPKYSLSWFLPPGAKKPENSDPLVQLESKPEVRIYVRAFGGFPSLENGRENAKQLREALNMAGKTFDPDNYSGAGYESYFSLTHHNEIWINAA